MSKRKTVMQKCLENFHTLCQAVVDGRVALMECQDSTTNEVCAVVCAVNIDETGESAFVPVARMFLGNPYEMLRPPNCEGGFHPADGEEDASSGKTC